MDVHNDIATEKKLAEAAPIDSALVASRSRKRNIITFIVTCSLSAALLVLLAQQLLTPAANQKQTDAGASNPASAVGDVNSPLIGQTAPDFTLSALNGHTVIHFAHLKGTPVVLNFWASWCAPCNDEAPFLQKSWPMLRQQGITFIGIDGPEKDGSAFLKKYGIAYPNLQDTQDGATAISYGVTSFPETVFIAADGKVVAKWLGPLNKSGLDFEIAKLKR